MTICLWWRHRSEAYLDVEIITMLRSVAKHELSTIICDDDSGNVVPCYYVSPKELANLPVSDGAKGLWFHIHTKIINGHNH